MHSLTKFVDLRSLVISTSMLTQLDSDKFLNCLESCNINQHVHKPTHQHGHILDLFNNSDSSAVLNVWISEFLSDHALVLFKVGFINPSVPRSKISNFLTYHKIKMDSL